MLRMKLEITINHGPDVDVLIDRLGLLETNLIRRLEQMATVADLTTGFDTIDAAITKLGGDLTTTLTDLAAVITAGGTGPDLQPFVDRAQAIATQLANFDSTVVAADQKPA